MSYLTRGTTVVFEYNGQARTGKVDHSYTSGSGRDRCRIVVPVPGDSPDWFDVDVNDSKVCRVHGADWSKLMTYIGRGA